MFQRLLPYLFTIIFTSVLCCQTGSMKYYRSQFEVHPDFQTVINNPKLQSYLANPDSMNLQLLYGWGKDIGLKHPSVGFWIADTMIKISISKLDKRATISAYSLLAQMHSQESNFTESIKAFKEAINFGERNLDFNEHPNFDKLGINYCYLGDLYLKMGDIQKAKIAYQKGWDLLKIIDDDLIKHRDSINKLLPRDFTTYSWDKLYAKSKLAIISFLTSETKKDTLQSIQFLDEVYNTHDIRDALIKLNTGLYLSQAYQSINSPKFLDFLEEIYEKSIYAGIFEIQVKSGLILFDTYNKKGNLTQKELYELLHHILLASRKINDLQGLYKSFERLSKLLRKKNDNDALNYLDSAYYYKNKFYEQEKQREIGKAESDMMYQNSLIEAKIKEDIATKNFQITLISSLILFTLILVLAYLLFERKKNLNELSKQNLKIKEQKNVLQTLVSAKDKLLGIISHDLRNPIKEFKLLTNDINARQNSDNALSNDLDYLNSSAEQLETLLNSLLDYADSNLHHDFRVKSEVNLHYEVTRILNLYDNEIRKKNLKIHIDYELTTITSVEEVVQLVLRNIIQNAIKFSYNDGQIKISTKKEDDFTIIRIQDFGMGISNEDINKIDNYIRPFVKEPIQSEIGTGFGLLTVKEQLEQIGGELYFESELNKGTIVHIYL